MRCFSCNRLTSWLQTPPMHNRVSRPGPPAPTGRLATWERWELTGEARSPHPGRRCDARRGSRTGEASRGDPPSPGVPYVGASPSNAHKSRRAPVTSDRSRPAPNRATRLRRRPCVAARRLTLSSNRGSGGQQSSCHRPQPSLRGWCGRERRGRAEGVRGTGFAYHRTNLLEARLGLAPVRREPVEVSSDNRVSPTIRRPTDGSRVPAFQRVGQAKPWLFLKKRPRNGALARPGPAFPPRKTGQGLKNAALDSG